MQVVKLCDGASVIMVYDFSVGATVVTGTPVIATTSTGSGVLTPATTTSFLDALGICIGASSDIPEGQGFAAGTLTYSTTQATVSAAGGNPFARVIVNPSQIVRARLSGGATSGTALTAYTNSTADTTGLTFSSTALGTSSMSGGMSWIIAGNNTGNARRITTWTNATSFAVTIPYPQTLGTSDQALVAPIIPASMTTLQLTTDVTEVNATIAYGTGGNGRAVAMVLSAAATSYVDFIFRDHAFNELS